jgi:hypothetical protein
MEFLSSEKFHRERGPLNIYGNFSWCLFFPGELREFILSANWFPKKNWDLGADILWKNSVKKIPFGFSHSRQDSHHSKRAPPTLAKRIL